MTVHVSEYTFGTHDHVSVNARDTLAYKAPFLIEKLVKERVAQTAAEAEELFAEVKRYMVLAQSDRTMIWNMYSLRVDEAWHQFILFTKQYTDFCLRFFGVYFHHRPSNAPEPDVEAARTLTTFDQFRHRYAKLFGSDLPDVWYDERNVTPERRVVNDLAGAIELRDNGEMIDLVTPDGKGAARCPDPVIGPWRGGCTFRGPLGDQRLSVGRPKPSWGQPPMP